MGNSDLNLIKQKQAERVVDVLLSEIVEGTTFTSTYKEALAEKVQRILSPEFDEYRDDFESSNIACLAYDKVAAVLQVDFQSGGRYQYFGVEPDKAGQLLESESKGKFLNREIKKNYPYMQVQ